MTNKKNILFLLLAISTLELLSQNQKFWVGDTSNVTFYNVTTEFDEIDTNITVNSGIIQNGRLIVYKDKGFKFKFFECNFRDGLIEGAESYFFGNGQKKKTQNVLYSSCSITIIAIDSIKNEFIDTIYHTNPLRYGMFVSYYESGAIKESGKYIIKNNCSYLKHGRWTRWPNERMSNESSVKSVFEFYEFGKLVKTVKNKY